MGPVSMYLHVITALRTSLVSCRRAESTDLLSPLLGVSRSSGTGVQTGTPVMVIRQQAGASGATRRRAMLAQHWALHTEIASFIL